MLVLSVVIEIVDISTVIVTIILNRIVLSVLALHLVVQVTLKESRQSSLRTTL